MARKHKQKRPGYLTIVFVLVLVMYALWMLSADSPDISSAPEQDTAGLNQRLNALQLQVEARDKLLHDSIAVQTALTERVEKLEGLVGKELAILAARPSQVRLRLVSTVVLTVVCRM
jgi:hypothetical protein